jgi:hypothetical protein
MSNTSVLRTAGQTVALSVTNTSHASVTINDNTNDQVNFASFLNTGAAPVAVQMTNYTPAPAAVFPVDGTSLGGFVLPAGMTTPIVLAVPTSPFYMTAISNSATASIIYVTPINDQS